MDELVSASRRLAPLAWACCLAISTFACGEIQPTQPDGSPSVPDAAGPLPDGATVPDSGALPDALVVPDSGGGVPDAQVTPDASQPPLRSITHSSSLSVQRARSLFCSDRNDPPHHTESSFFRVFHLPDYNVTRPFQVTRVLVGIEVAATLLDTQPAQIKLHTLAAGAELLLANLTPLDTYDLNISNREEPGNVEVVTNTLVPAGATLVVELFTPDGRTDGNLLIPGGNGAGQTGPSYMTAAGCSVSEPTEWATLQADGVDRHLVMSVYGRESL